MSDKALGANKIEKPGIQSLARAFAILECIGQTPGGVQLSELSKAVELNNSTAFHLVKTMVQLGYVRQDDKSKKYHIGRPMFLLAAAALNDVELSSIVSPILLDLARDSGETSHFAVWAGNNTAIMARKEGTSPLRVSEDPGTVRPAYATAVGKILLAHLQPHQLERYYTEVELTAFTPTTITDPERLTAELTTIRETGLAYDDAELFTEVRCAAVPVVDFKDDVIGAIGISGPVWRMSMTTLQGKLPMLQTAADRACSALGRRAQ
ncbi:MAG: IclR family transcriptional regulator [Thalassobaculaceae bacterium]|nr:IclR family transcriptional regulator [Thalassobaculaceae bacterium]